MQLPYCPNCRCDLDENKLAWICWRTYRRTTAARPREEVAHGADTIFGREESAGGAESFAAEAFEICYTYNAAAPKAPPCGKCTQPRLAPHFRNACPSCEMEIPRLENLRAQTITVAGPAGSGKTHYLVAVHSWWQQNLPSFGLNLLPAMGKTLASTFDEYRKDVLNRKQKVKATVEDRMFSFSWQIVPVDRRTPGLLFSLPDVSGESQIHIEGVTKTRHYHYSAGIIVILDGLRLAISLGLGPEEWRDPDDHRLFMDALMADLHNRLSPMELSNLPIALCVNKVDLLTKLGDGRWNKLMSQHRPRHDGYFDFEICERRSDAIEDLLLQCDDTRGLVQQAKNTFRNCMFFVMATIGSDPREGERLEFRPQGVGDPMLWMLWHLNMVP